MNARVWVRVPSFIVFSWLLGRGALITHSKHSEAVILFFLPVVGKKKL